MIKYIQVLLDDCIINGEPVLNISDFNYFINNESSIL
jgi:hypothetical protein